MTGIERTMIEVICAVILLCGIGLALEHRGAQTCLNADKAAVTKQEARNEVKGELDAQTINEEAKAFKNVVAAPDPVDVPHVQLCHYQASAVSSPKAPGPLPDASPPIRGQDTPPPRDVGPPLVKVGQEADAQIRALQDYVSRVCLVR